LDYHTRDIPLKLRLNLSTLKTTDLPVEHHEGHKVLAAIMIENSSSFNRIVGKYLLGIEKLQSEGMSNI